MERVPCSVKVVMTGPPLPHTECDVKSVELRVLEPVFQPFSGSNFYVRHPERLIAAN